MIIAPGVKVEDWNRLDLVDKRFNSEWEKAIVILEKRIRDRYLEPAKLLVECEESIPAVNRKYGFSIMAILCLLAETMQSFIDGENESNGSRKVFKKFLLENEPFKSKFKGNEDLADRFYKHIRCGILHQAEITGGSKLWSVGPTIKDESGRITVNRNKFFRGMQLAFEKYLMNLRRDDTYGEALRSKLERKIGFIIRNATIV